MTCEIITLKRFGFQCRINETSSEVLFQGTFHYLVLTLDHVDEIHSNYPSSVVNFQPVLFNQYEVQIFEWVDEIKLFQQSNIQHQTISACSNLP